MADTGENGVMPAMKQLSLPLSWVFPQDEENFVISECNEYAVKWLEKWPFKVRDNFVCLIGEKGAGKTHLAHVWASRMGAEFVNAADIFNRWYDIASTENTKRYFVLDDVDELGDDVMLLYMYNTIKEKNAHLLMTAKISPRNWSLKFDDIKSRMSTASVIEIRKPDEAAVQSIMGKMLLRRGICATTAVTEYIANRIERSYEAINYWVNKIDATLTQNQKKLTMHSIREML